MHNVISPKNSEIYVEKYPWFEGKDSGYSFRFYFRSIYCLASSIISAFSF
jgi:hypothetical protein